MTTFSGYQNLVPARKARKLTLVTCLDCAILEDVILDEGTDGSD